MFNTDAAALVSRCYRRWGGGPHTDPVFVSGRHCSPAQQWNGPRPQG